MSWDFGDGSSGQGFGDKLIIPSVREERLFSSNSIKFNFTNHFAKCPFKFLKESNIQFNMNMNMNMNNLFNKIDSKIDIFFKMLNKDKMQNIQYI